jgi:hypothetical protein
MDDRLPSHNVFSFGQINPVWRLTILFTVIWDCEVPLDTVAYST